MSIQVTSKFRIMTPASAVFEAFVDPAKISGFWFSSSSARWEEGKTVTLRYEEYNAEIEIQITAIEPNQRIVFQSYGHVVTITMTEENGSTVVAVTEEGWQEGEEELVAKLLGNQQGWTYVLSCLKAYLEHGVTNLRAALVF
jgi:uncharacterized protein YndB with AHSA1/START domain